jgi:hypothetical protein
MAALKSMVLVVFNSRNTGSSAANGYGFQTIDFILPENYQEKIPATIFILKGKEDQTKIKFDKNFQTFYDLQVHAVYK